MKYKIIILFLISIHFSFYGQCPSPERFIKVKSDKGGFIKNSQSRSAFIKSGEIFETVFICQGGYDYRFALDTYESNSGNLKYEIYEMVIVKDMQNGKPVYKKEKRVLFSSLDNTPIIISSADSRKIHVKLLLESSEEEVIACCGVLVEFKKAKKIGF